MIEEKDLYAAIDRIAKTPDGTLFYLFLQRNLMAITQGQDDGSLREQSGQRIFAARLMGLMAKGIEESGGRSESICTFSVAGPRRVSASRGAGRRISADTFVPGYDSADDDSSPGTGSTN